MFIRKKKNPSGVISIQIIDKSLGKYKVIRTIGSSSDEHVCICFVAYKVYKELERILKLNGINLSVDKVLNIAKTITTLKIKLPVSGETVTKTMLITAKHKTISQLFDQKFWEMI